MILIKKWRQFGHPDNTHESKKSRSRCDGCCMKCTRDGHHIRFEGGYIWGDDVSEMLHEMYRLVCCRCSSLFIYCEEDLEKNLPVLYNYYIPVYTIIYNSRVECLNPSRRQWYDWQTATILRFFETGWDLKVELRVEFLNLSGTCHRQWFQFVNDMINLRLGPKHANKQEGRNTRAEQARRQEQHEQNKREGTGAGTIGFLNSVRPWKGFWTM